MSNESKFDEPKFVFEKGDLIVFEKGSYSDFTYLGVYRALEHFDVREQLRTFLEDYPRERETFDDDRHFGRGYFGFVAWLVARAKVAEEVPYASVYLGDYGGDWEPALLQAPDKEDIPS